MKLFGFDISVQRRESATGVPSSTTEGLNENKPQVAEGANYPDRTVYVRDPRTALTVSAVYRATELRARTMGLMPVQWQKRDMAGGNYVEDMRGLGKRMNYLLQVQPNPLMTAAQLWELVTVNQLMFGNGFVYVERDEMEFPVALWSVVYGSYNIATGLYNLTYLGEFGYMERINVPRRDVLHFPNTYRIQGGVWGISTIQHAIETLSYIKTQKAQNLDTAAKGGRIKGFIGEERQTGGGTLAAGMYGKKAADDYAQELQRKLYSGQDIVAIRGLEKFQNISMTAQDMQMMDMLGISLDDCARYYATPRPLLMLDTNSHYNDYTNATMEYLQRTIAPLARELEDLFDTKFLTQYDFGQRRFHMCELPLLRMDLEKQAKVDQMRLKMGWTVNEIRNQYDMPAVEKGDIVYIETNVAELGSPKLSEVSGGRSSEDKTDEPAPEPEPQK